MLKVLLMCLLELSLTLENAQKKQILISDAKLERLVSITDCYLTCNTLEKRMTIHCKFKLMIEISSSPMILLEKARLTCSKYLKM